MKNEKMCFYLKLEPYLRQWIMAKNGGVEPIDFQRGSIERDLIMMNVTRLPKGEEPDVRKPGYTAVVLHNIRGRNNASYNHLPRKIKEELKALLKRRFDWQLMMDLLSPKNHGRQMTELIFEWMEANGIDTDEKNFNSISKRFQRRRKYYGLKFTIKQRKTNIK